MAHTHTPAFNHTHIECHYIPGAGDGGMGEVMETERAIEGGWRDRPPGLWRGVGGILQVAVENKSILY